MAFRTQIENTRINSNISCSSVQEIFRDRNFFFSEEFTRSWNRLFVPEFKWDLSVSYLLFLYSVIVIWILTRALAFLLLYHNKNMRKSVSILSNISSNLPHFVISVTRMLNLITIVSLLLLLPLLQLLPLLLPLLLLLIYIPFDDKFTCTKEFTCVY
jgi:hypothetical protein